jgi:two-component sensor histidine kinase
LWGEIARSLIAHLPVHGQPFWRGQAIALGTLCAALAMRASIDPFIGGGLYFNFLFPAVLVAGLFGGIWSAASVAVLGGLMSAYIWIPPTFVVVLHGEGIFRLVSFWVLAAMMVLVTSLVHVALDRLAAAESHAKTVASEMKHRVQNNLTLVQAIVRQTLQNSDDLSEVRRLLTDRLAALVQTHDLIDNFEEKEVSLERVVRKALEPFDVRQFAIAGPSSVIIAQDYLLSLMLLIHELATNAAKYGALSDSAGRVAISWTENPTAHKVSIDWKERFGPRVDQPSRIGFGSKLLRAAFGANIIYEPDGVHCTVAFPTD